jgi:hypothetical protein
MINWTEYVDVWPKVKRAARTTIGRKGEGTYPTDSWKKTILLAEHSPIRKIKFSWKWIRLKYWVSVHFVRHCLGILHWVRTQRDDRTGVDRDNSPQKTLVEHECEANAQALINISRRRLCSLASHDTRVAWLEVKAEVAKVDPVLASVMVPECIYRGFCPEWEHTCCGYVNTEAYKTALTEYRNKEV